MFCNSCGAKNVAESNFCRQCGRKMDKQSAPKISEEAFDRALPEDEQVTALLERAYRRRKENDLVGAIAICNEVLQLRPESTTAHGILGQLYEQNGEREKAVEQYERVLKLNPGSIADRVKLDDLREGVARPDTRNRGKSQVVIVDPNGAPLRALMIWGIGLCAVLILTGAALAVAFSRHDTQQANNQNGSYPTKQVSLDGQNSRANSGADEAGSGRSSTQSASSAPAGSGFGSSAYNPQYGFPAIQYTAPPPVYVYPQAPSPHPGLQVAKNNSAGTSPSRPVKTVVPPERDFSDADRNSERIHLNVTEGSDPANDGHNIPVPNASHDQLNARPGPNQGPDSSGKIVVRPHQGSTDASASFTPSAESAALMAVADEKLRKLDYAGAIIAFGKALAGANDETAYVWQQMGECYRNMNQNKNATSCYEHGRDEYNKLIKAGRQVEHATTGLKICENGIKICGSE